MMKTTALTISLALAASALPVLAQDSTPAPSPAAKTHWWGGRMFHAWKTLTPEEQQKLKSARQAVHNNPDVVAARTKLKADAKVFHDTQKAAMLKNDPTLAPVLEKLEKARKDAKQD